MNKQIIGAAMLSAALLLGGCTKKFDELNTDKTKLTTLGASEYPFLFSKAQSAASYKYADYQVAQNLFADLYAQYFATSATYFPSDRYTIVFDWLPGHWLPQYTEVVPQLKTLMANTEANSAENALAQIWWVWSFHRITDYYGPIPYSKAGEPLASIPYDSQEQIYNDFFTRLNAAIAVLNSNSTATPYGNFDLIYGGDISKWKKFANTLKLRLAMRISKVNPTKAKAEAEAAIAAGVMTSEADDAYMKTTPAGNDANGLAGIAGWNEFRMSATMESVLKGYSDPRMGVYFQPASATGGYDGIRNGLTATQLGQSLNSNDNNSNVGTRWVTGSGANWNNNLSTPRNIMHAAEAYFLRAEAAFLGWNAGSSAKQLYEKGIETSMRQWGITDAAAINAYINSAAQPVAPADALNSPAVNDYPIAWAADPTTQLKQIAQQKWLALYPDGFEAWADVRRMGVLQQYPVVNSDNADLPVGTRIRRIPFIDLEKNTNGTAVQAAVPLLGGPDKASTKLWWDKN
ncbi:SusD/RagB family nutrient-binding outer membrane lipoprotein [Phnomibacter ginsenosidimutans]|uniref:SusD/RagB family nutrient-binding outer membrane lipoprotein n=1 Tax=Phnomibacter ginsenosidimutans TaxID=2676868 RepID=A0A6I6GGE8_9BACT|nr:SusD/RagB family nutrient-binding outer membrane lipoprotein [Phnomibacter ginsenosidimutans]QGW27425.1 SusD/RagB family nutrient-binding outer membrane lipoprotein [Phnomibacter ginsenosidimutans]